MAGNKGEMVEKTSDESFVTLDTNPPLSSKIQTVGSNFDGNRKKESKSSKVKSDNTSSSKEAIFGIPVFSINWRISLSIFIFNNLGIFF